MSHDPLDRLHRRLVEAVRRASPDAVDRPLTIADVYQHLVPYRLVRGELGFGELQEYEHTLLRLFAGERDYLQVDVPQVFEEFRRELRSPNPILGIYRDYAAVAVSLNPTAARGIGESPAQSTGGTSAAVSPTQPVSPEVGRSATIPNSAPAREAVAQPPHPGSTPPAAPRSPAAPSPADVRPVHREAEGQTPPHGEVTLEADRDGAEPAATCWNCSEPLPARREVRFCPHCGTVQVPTPCDECGSPVEPVWKFCVQCGSPRAPLPMMTSG